MKGFLKTWWHCLWRMFKGHRNEICKPEIKKIRLEAKVGCNKCSEPAKAPYSYWGSGKIVGGDYCEKHLEEIKNACKNCYEFISKGTLVGCKACNNTRLAK